MPATEEYPEVPVALHQDHGNSPQTCISAIELGFTSVMMDGSPMPKFSRKPDAAILAMDVIERIHRRLPDTHLVMHGSSSVPAILIDRINAAGGSMRPAFGVPVKEIQLGIRSGVRKVNVDTGGRLAITAAVREALASAPDDFDPRLFTRAARDGMPLAEMRARYDGLNSARANPTGAAA